MWVDKRGYVRHKFKGQMIKGHQLAWLQAYGEMPPGQIDHIDGDKTNNDISNLRLATASQQQINRPHPLSSNTSGVTGVCRTSGGWIARIGVSKRKVNLGTFGTLAKAAGVRAVAEVAYFGEYAPNRGSEIA